MDYQTHWKLKQFMDIHRIKPSDLARATKGQLSRTSIYGLLQDERPRGVNFATLDALIPALSGILNEQVEVTDLITYGSKPETPVPRKKAWRRLIGALQDPDSPGDIATRHDDYLAEAVAEEQDAGTLRGRR